MFCNILQVLLMLPGISALGTQFFFTGCCGGGQMIQDYAGQGKSYNYFSFSFRPVAAMSLESFEGHVGL